jgi:hypothetical protein
MGEFALQITDSLQRLVLDSLPQSFLERLLARQAGVYAEARAMAYAGQWGNPEAETVFPHNRRGLMENEVRLTATESGLACIDARHMGDNCGYVQVLPGKIRLTTHHVDKPTRFVPRCQSREQNRAVNEWMEPYLEGTLQELPPQLGDSDAANAYLLHGLITEKRGDAVFTSMFLRVAIPDPEISRYVRNFDVIELLQFYSSLNNPGVIDPNSGSLQDNARPVMNVKPEIAKEERPEKVGS